MRRVLGDFVLGFALVLGLCGFVGCGAKHYESVAVGEFSQKTFSIKRGQVYLLFVSGENLGVNLNAKGENSVNLKQNSQNTRHSEPATAGEESTGQGVSLKMDSSHSANTQNDEKGENSQKNSRANAQNSAQNAIVHFVLTDTLGVPKLKKDFINGRFKSVAFLPPNAEFDELFVQILRQIAAQKGGKIEFEFEDYEVKEL